MECHHGGRLEGAFAAVRVCSRVVLCFVIVVTISGEYDSSSTDLLVLYTFWSWFSGVEPFSGGDDVR